MGCGINFLSENLVDSANVSLTTGTENAQFPLENIKNDATAVKFRSLENSIVIEFDLQQTRTIDAVALHGDTNGTLGLTTASVKTSLTTDFSSSVAQNIPLSGDNLIGYLFFDTPVDHRYVELTLTGTGSYAELSNIFIGERINLPFQNLSIGSFDYGQQDKSSGQENDYGQRFINKRNKLKYLAGNIDFATKDEQQTLDDMFTRHGTSEPLWMIVDEDGASINDGEFKLTIYGYLSERPGWSASGGQTYNTSVKVNQAG
jgi:hypothetical protein